MEETSATPNQSVDQAQSPVPNKRKKWVIAGLILLLVVIAIVVWRVYIRHQPLTPAETLQQLEATSQPVTATQEERKAELDALKKSSEPVNITEDESIKLLQQLRAQ